MRMLCPVCGKPVPCGCKKKASRSRRTPDQERERNEKNPSRSRYKSKAYKRACQLALSRTDGRCAVTGKRIADMRGGKWVMRPGGGVHHIVPIREGGTDDPSNLVPLCASVHNAIDAELRKSRRRQ